MSGVNSITLQPVSHVAVDSDVAGHDAAESDGSDLRASDKCSNSLSAAVLCHPPSWCDAACPPGDRHRDRGACACCQYRGGGSSLFHGYVAADNSFQVAVRRPQEQRAGVIQGFRLPVPRAHTDRDTLAERCALFRPFVGNAGKAATAKTIIIEIEFAKNDGSEFGAANGAACFEAQGGRNAAHIGREVGVCRVYVHTDTEDDITNAIDLGGEFGEHSRELSVPIKISLGHLIDGARSCAKLRASAVAA